MFEMKQQHRPELWEFVRLVLDEDVVNKIREETRRSPSKLTTRHAKFAFCLKCKCKIDAQVGRHGVKEHMQYFHREELVAFQAMHEAGQAARQTRLQPMLSRRHRPHETANRSVDRVDDEIQKEFDQLVAMWIAQSGRPLSIVKFLSHELAGVDVKIPCRTHVRQLIPLLAAELRRSLIDAVKKECEYYILTTDIWTDRAARSYMSLTLHYLMVDFEPRNWTLKVTQFAERHTGPAIAAAIDTLLEDWHLDPQLVKVAS